MSDSGLSGVSSKEALYDRLLRSLEQEFPGSLVETERLTICYMLVIPRKWQDLTEEEKLATRERINNDIATQEAEGKTVIVVDDVPLFYEEEGRETRS